MGWGVGGEMEPGFPFGPKHRGWLKRGEVPGLGKTLYSSGSVFQKTTQNVLNFFPPLNIFPFPRLFAFGCVF